MCWVLRPLAVGFIELPLALVHTVDIEVRIIANIERSDNAIIGSWLSVGGHALPDQKNLLREALDIVAVFHHRNSSKCCTSFFIFQREAETLIGSCSVCPVAMACTYGHTGCFDIAPLEECRFSMRG